MAKKAAAHHGGAWKVAYADFVTAMMALFMVLWITSQDKEILIATSRYFKQPFNAVTDQSVGIMPGNDGGSVGKDKTMDKASAANLSFMKSLASELQRLLNVHDPMADPSIELRVTSDALRITLYDRTKQPLFEKGTAKPTEWGRLTLQNLAWIIDRNRLNVYIDGFTAAGAAGGKDNYGPWELSTDRANSARRLLEQYAVDQRKIDRVTGYGDTRPLANQNADSDSNDRIVLSLSATP